MKIYTRAQTPPGNRADATARVVMGLRCEPARGAVSRATFYGAAAFAVGMLRLRRLLGIWKPIFSYREGFIVLQRFASLFLVIELEDLVVWSKCGWLMI